MSGAIDYATSDPRIQIGGGRDQDDAVGVQAALARLISPRIRSWVVDRVSGGNIERVVIATNAPMSTLEPGGPPLPDDGLSIDIVSNGNTLSLVDGLPVLRDADLITHVQGRTATVKVGKSTVDLPSGRKITLSNGVFEVPDTQSQTLAGAHAVPRGRQRRCGGRAFDARPPEGCVEYCARPFDHQGHVRRPGRARLHAHRHIDQENMNYVVDADLSNFSVEKWVRGQKVEATALKLFANSQGFRPAAM